MLQGPYDNAKENLQGFTSALRRIINPNFERQEFVRNRIVEDPDYAQKLADQEAESPGFLAGAGLDDKLINVIVKRPQSSDSIVRVKKRAIVRTSNILDDPDSKDAVADQAFGIDRLGRAKDRAAIENVGANTISTRVTTEGNRIDNVIKGIDAELKKDEATLMPLIMQGKTAELNEAIFKTQQQGTARQLMEKHKETLRKGLIQARREIDPTEFATMMANPQFSSLFEADWKSDLAAKEATWQKQLASIRLSTANKDFYSQQLQKRMADNVDALVDRGINHQAATSYINLNPEEQAKYELMDSAPENPVEAQLWQVAQAQKQIVKERLFQAQNSGVFGKLRSDIKAIQMQTSRAKDPIDLDEAINQMNLMSELSLGKGRLVFGKVQTNKGVFGFGQEHSIVVTGGSEIGMADKLGFDSIDDPVARDAWEAINSGKESFEDLMRDPTIPDDYKRKIKTFRMRYEVKKPMSERKGSR